MYYLHSCITDIPCIHAYMYIHIHIIALFLCKAVACCALSVAASDSPHASFLHWLCCFAWERSWWLDQVCKRLLLYAPKMHNVWLCGVTAQASGLSRNVGWMNRCWAFQQRQGMSFRMPSSYSTPLSAWCWLMTSLKPCSSSGHRQASRSATCIYCITCMSPENRSLTATTTVQCVCPDITICLGDWSWSPCYVKHGGGQAVPSGLCVCQPL